MARRASSRPARPLRPARPARPRVLVVTGSVGAGHDGAAHELASRLRAAGVDVAVRDWVAALPVPARRVLRDLYSPVVDRAPRLFDLLFTGIETTPAVRAAVGGFCALGRRGLTRWVDELAPDVVVSTYPLASQGLGELRRRGRLAAPVVTYLTDPAAHRTWVHPHVDVHLTVTAGTAHHGERTYGVPMAVGGPLVPAAFTRAPSRARTARLRRELGAPVGRPLVLVAAGSLGLGDPLTAARDVLAAGMTPLLLCGRNTALRGRAGAVPGVVALGWRTDVADLLGVADVLVHNAGGLSMTEALVAGLPAVTYRPIPGHGRANAAVLAASGLAPWARDAGELAVALRAQVAAGRRRQAHPDPADAVLELLAAGRVTRAA